MHTSTIRHGGRTGTRRCLWLMGLSTLLACADPTTSPSPRPAAPPPSSAALAVSTTTFAPIEDALNRAFPALSDDAAAAGLRTAVEAVLDALSRKDDAAASDAIARAEDLLDVYARAVGPENGDAADLDAIALALASARP